MTYTNANNHTLGLIADFLETRRPSWDQAYAILRQLDKASLVALARKRGLVDISRRTRSGLIHRLLLASSVEIDYFGSKSRQSRIDNLFRDMCRFGTVEPVFALAVLKMIENGDVSERAIRWACQDAGLL